MKEFTIINSAKKTPLEMNEKDFYRSQSAGDATSKIEEVCRENPDTHITVYGGDGSVYEAVNAIMNSGAQDGAELTIVPFGTGNDFVKSLPSESGVRKKIDLIKFNDKYSANIINIGFDCDVVRVTEKLKKLRLVRGSIAYAIGVVAAVFNKLGKKLDIEFTLEDGSVEHESGEHLLCVIANGRYYGGGFCCAPNAEIDDGILEVIIVRKISRLRFAKFIGGYKKGLHILPDGSINPKYESILIYKRCKALKISNVMQLCADGEIIDCKDADISVVNKAINIIT
ncbi:MAG: hypothetical protein J6M35_08820 [Clostridia bacterium]|nr:hypothetical protein [Clostridia bacterium]